MSDKSNNQLLAQTIQIIQMFQQSDVASWLQVKRSMNLTCFSKTLDDIFTTQVL